MSWPLQAIWQGHELATLVIDLHIPGDHRVQLGQGHFDGQLFTCFLVSLVPSSLERRSVAIQFWKVRAVELICCVWRCAAHAVLETVGKSSPRSDANICAYERICTWLSFFLPAPCWLMLSSSLVRRKSVRHAAKLYSLRGFFAASCETSPSVSLTTSSSLSAPPPKSSTRLFRPALSSSDEVDSTSLVAEGWVLRKGFCRASTFMSKLWSYLMHS